IEEQPVALASSSRSPYSCVSNLMYGVSPHPAQAPENSNIGGRNCEPLVVYGLIRLGAGSGIFRKYSQLAASASRREACGCIVIAFLSVLAPVSSLA